MADIQYKSSTTRAQVLATAGGQGSFSYADTTVYGNRDDKTPYANRVWGLVGGIWVPVSTGPATGPLIVPGTGGGAKLPGKRYHGSRARGFNPNGAVLIRLFKVE